MSEQRESTWRRFVEWVRGWFGLDDEFSESDNDYSVSSTMPLEEAKNAVVEFDEIIRRRDDALAVQFRHNLDHPVTVEQVTLSGTEFFNDHRWRLQPGFNLLLGRNGYGKSFLLRSAVALMKRREDISEELLTAMGGQKARLELSVRRRTTASSASAEQGIGTELERIVRSLKSFDESIGELPVLAIPDSRFADRSNTVLQPPATDTDLLTAGASHFLMQMPYQGLIEEILFEMCQDSRDARSVDIPAFRFLEGVLERLTQRPLRFVSVERSGRTGFQLQVRMEDSGQVLPIQYASQGTLSIIAMFGLIRSFLNQVVIAGRDGSTLRSTSKREHATEEEIKDAAGTVFIDELDAHLHPFWQQQMRMLLIDTFPNVQFVVSAHSPLIVAGCGPGEVAVLRSAKQGFEPVLLERDFIGATSKELYEIVFEIEELDQTYLRYRTKSSASGPIDEQIGDLLERRDRLDTSEMAELNRLLQERQLIDRVDEVAKQRQDESQVQKLRILELEAEVERLTRRLTRESDER